MSLFKRMRLTDAGVDLLRMVHEGQPLELLSIHVGNGMWSEEERTGTPPAALKTSKRAVAITEYEKQGGAVVLNGVLSNTGLTEGFMMTEMGVTARHPENGELLYMADFVPPELASYLPPASDAPVEMPLRVIVKAGTGAEVVVEIEDRFVSASKKDLTAHINAADPHPEMRAAVPTVSVPAGGVAGDGSNIVNEGASFSVKLGEVASAGSWQVENRVRVLDSLKKNVTDQFTPELGESEVSFKAPQVNENQEYTLQLQTWQHGGLVSAWSEPLAVTVRHLPVKPPSFIAPLDNAAGIGETPTLSTTAGSAEDSSKEHTATEYLVTKDRSRVSSVCSSGVLGAVTEWKVPEGHLITGKHYYLHARVRWGDEWSPWVTIDISTAELFQFIDPPELLEPVEGGEVSGAKAELRLKPIVVDSSQPAQHTKTEYELKHVGTNRVIKTEVVTKAAQLLNIKLPFMERLQDFALGVRVHDEVRGWSDKTTVHFATNEKSSYLVYTADLLSAGRQRGYFASTKYQLGLLTSERNGGGLYGELYKVYFFDPVTGEPTKKLIKKNGATDTGTKVPRIRGVYPLDDEMIVVVYGVSSSDGYLGMFNTRTMRFEWFRKSNLLFFNVTSSGEYIYAYGVANTDGHWSKQGIYRLNKSNGTFVSGWGVDQTQISTNSRLLMESGFGGCFVGHAYTIGFLNSQGQYSGTCWRYTWAGSPIVLKDAAGANGLLYTVGGQEHSAGYTATFMIFNPTSKQFVSGMAIKLSGVSSYNSMLADYSRVVVVGEKVLVSFFGGDSGSYLFKYSMTGQIEQALHFTGGTPRIIDAVKTTTGTAILLGTRASNRNSFYVECTDDFSDLNLSDLGVQVKEIPLNELAVQNLSSLSKRPVSISQAGSIPSSAVNMPSVSSPLAVQENTVQTHKLYL